MRILLHVECWQVLTHLAEIVNEYSLTKILVLLILTS